MKLNVRHGMLVAGLCLSLALDACATTTSEQGTADQPPQAAVSQSSGGHRVVKASRSSGPSASAKAALRARAACAQVELALAIGEKVSSADKRRCTRTPSPPKPKAPPAQGAVVIQPEPASAPPPPEPAPEVIETVKTPPIPERKKHTSPPDWVERPPVEDGTYYGVGHGREFSEGFKNAALAIAAQIEVSVNAELDSDTSQKEVTVERDGRSMTTYKASESISLSSQMMVKGAISDVVVIDQYVDSKAGKTWVLASLDIAALRAAEQAVIDAVLEAIATGTARFVNDIRRRGVIDQRMLYELLGVLHDVKATARSKIGRSIRSAWRTEERMLKSLLERAFSCVQMNRIGQQGTKNTAVLVTCGGFRVVNARLLTQVDGGFMDVHDVISSNALGVMDISHGKVYGKDNVGLAFVHDIKGVAGANFVKVPEPDNRAYLRFDANAPAVVKVVMNGVSDAEKKVVSEMFSGWLQRKYSAEMTQGRADVTASLTLEFGNLKDLGGRFMQAVGIKVSVASPTGVIFQDEARTGATATDADDARLKAVRNVLDRMGRW